MNHTRAVTAGYEGEQLMGLGEGEVYYFYQIYQKKACFDIKDSLAKHTMYFLLFVFVYSITEPQAVFPDYFKYYAKDNLDLPLALLSQFILLHLFPLNLEIHF